MFRLQRNLRLHTCHKVSRNSQLTSFCVLKWKPTLSWRILHLPRLPDVRMDFTDSPTFLADPADPAIATTTWICPFLAAAITSRASVWSVAKVMAVRLVRAALMVTMEMLSGKRTANVSYFCIFYFVNVCFCMF